jgi:hypothetical protein
LLFQNKTTKVESENYTREEQKLATPTTLLDSTAAHKLAYPDLIDFDIRTPVEDHSCVFMLSYDLVLPSCGIVSLTSHRKLVPIHSSAHVCATLLPQFGTEVSPVTPVSGSASPNSLSLVSKPVVLNQRTLQRHRYSLPTNSLLQPDGAVIDSSFRTKTPEITITEEHQLGQGGIIGTPLDLLMWSPKGTSKDLSISKRICRSYEDVNTYTTGLPIVKAPPSSIVSGGFKLPTLLPLRKSGNRGGSQQDIPDSVVSMKGSHSDNALRENPFQANNNVNQKRDMVLAPLGKLARGMQNLGASYLDPRKLRDSFKPVIKKEEVDDPSLDEKKKKCKTLIIDI